MLDTEKIKGIISKSLQKFAAENNVDFSKVQVRITAGENLLPKYSLLVGEFEKKQIELSNYKRDINFLKEIVGIPYAALDYFGIDDMNNTFMQKAFKRYMEKYNIAFENISLVIFSLKPDVVDAVIGLYNNTSAIAQIKFDEIFNQQYLLTTE